MSQISRKYQKDYKNLDYQNPRIVRDKKKIKMRLWRVIFSIAIAALFSLIYFLFFSPVFDIKQIEINGLNKVKKQSIDQIVDNYRFARKWFVLPRNNFWLFDCDEIKHDILEKYFFDKLEIKKKLFNQVILNLAEKESTVNWFTGNQCFHIDPTGTAIEYCEESGGLLKIKDMKNGDLVIGKNAIGSDELINIIGINDQLKFISQGKFEILNYEKYDNSLTAKTLEGLLIYFNAARPAGEQTGRLQVLLNQIENLNALEYIDLRFGEKIFYK